MGNELAFPANWLIAQDWSPSDHMLNLKGKDYLGIQMRQLWFIRDQRALIAAGLDHSPYVLRTELVELDREAGWAHFKTTARDVLGNESVAYGSESAKDFPDYIEKAATKSLGRALVGLGYGTGMAPEMDEGERVVDAPVERRQNAATRLQPAQAQQHAPTPPRPPAPAQPGARRPTDGPANEGDTGAHPTDAQATAIAKLCAKLNRPTPVFYTYTAASRLISVLTAEVKREQAAQAETAAAHGHDLHDLHEAFPAGQRGA